MSLSSSVDRRDFVQAAGTPVPYFRDLNNNWLPLIPENVNAIAEVSVYDWVGQVNTVAQKYESENAANKVLNDEIAQWNKTHSTGKEVPLPWVGPHPIRYTPPSLGH